MNKSQFRAICKALCPYLADYPCAHVIDIGARDGQWRQFLIEACGQYTAVEFKYKYGRYFSKYEFRHISEGLPYFDVCFAYDSITQMQRFTHDEIAQNMRPGGLLITVTPEGGYAPNHDAECGLMRVDRFYAGDHEIIIGRKSKNGTEHTT